MRNHIGGLLSPDCHVVCVRWPYGKVGKLLQYDLGDLWMDFDERMKESIEILPI
jgi:hypothetical protein